MACPFFMPTHRAANGSWLHPTRLPLGSGWNGYCCAPGHQGTEPSDEEIRELCNLGYAHGCRRLPQERPWDAIRFSVARHGDTRIVLCFVCEAAHHPVEHGTLEYDPSLARWVSSHRDLRVQRMAECYLDSYLLRKNQPMAGSTSSVNACQTKTN